MRLTVQAEDTMRAHSEALAHASREASLRIKTESHFLGKTAKLEAELASLRARLAAREDQLAAALQALHKAETERDEAQEDAECCRTTAVVARGKYALYRIEACAELASLRALLVRAGEALAPMAAMLCLVDEKDPSKGRAFDRFADEAVLFNVGKDRAITAGDLRRAFAVSASITRATQTDTTDAEAGT